MMAIARQVVWMLVAIVFASLFLLFTFLSEVEAQGCSILEFNRSHTQRVPSGTVVVFSGRSNCGTVKFELEVGPGDVRSYAETGQPNQTWTWNTGETGTGQRRVCFVARGDGGWENANRSCENYEVYGAIGSPPGSEHTGNNRCWIDAFTATPSPVRQGDSVQLAGSGTCDGGFQSNYFIIDGNQWGEGTSPVNSRPWGTANVSIGYHRICFHVRPTANGTPAESCVNVQVIAASAPPPTPAAVQGPQTDNGQAGQTGQSGPNQTYNPTAVPQQNPPQSQNPPVNNDAGTSNSGGSNNNGGSSNTLNTNNSGHCSNGYSRLSVGSIASVSDADPAPLYVRAGANLDSAVIDQIPVRTLVTIISGPVCNNGWTWWEIGYNGRSGWAAEVDSRRLYNLIPNGSSSSNNSGGSNSGGSSNSTSCARQVNMTVGGQGTVLPGSRNNIRSRADGSSTQLGQIWPGEVFTVTGNAVCAGGLQWWPITFNGISGWTAAGDAANQWIEPVWSGGSGNLPNPTSEPAQQTIQIVQVGGYALNVNPRTCAILNGAELVRREIQAFESGFPFSGNLSSKWTALQYYFALDTGRVEILRMNVRDEVHNQINSCSNPYYLVGSAYMDLNGLGNVIYGYFFQAYPWIVEEIVADYYQGQRDGFGSFPSYFQTFIDFPDDRSQRALGRSLAQQTMSSALITDSLVEQIATQVGLH